MGIFGVLGAKRLQYRLKVEAIRIGLKRIPVQGGRKRTMKRLCAKAGQLSAEKQGYKYREINGLQIGPIDLYLG